MTQYSHNAVLKQVLLLPNIWEENLRMLLCLHPGQLVFYFETGVSWPLVYQETEDHRETCEGR